MDADVGLAGKERACEYNCKVFVWKTIEGRKCRIKFVEPTNGGVNADLTFRNDCQPGSVAYAMWMIDHFRSYSARL